MAHTIAHHNTALETLADTVSQFWTAFLNKMTTVNKDVQIARLTRAMDTMSNDQLAQIGITRREISDYAKMVVRVNG